jgi:prolyl-tRNA synthetase
MYYSTLPTKTSKDVPSDETSKNAQLLIKAGFVQKTMAGVYGYLPLGLRVLNKIEGIVRKNMDAVGSKEIFMNSLHPRSWWEQTGRWETADILFKLKSQTDNEYALACSHEEQVVPAFQNFISSFKDLPIVTPDNGVVPLSVYQIQTKFRDELRSKSGLLRGREFRMKDAYDFHQNQQSCDNYYEVMKQAYFKTYSEMGMQNVFATSASGGMFTSLISHEFQVECEAGEDWTVVFSDDTRYNVEVAEGYSSDTHSLSGGEMERRDNLGEAVKSVKDHARAAGVDDSRILKSVLYKTQEEISRYVGVVIRGDLEVNEEKLGQILGCEFKLGEESDLEKIGTVRGRFSPINEIANGYLQPILWIYDQAIVEAKDMVSGYHIHVDVDRDCIKADVVDCVCLVKTGFIKKGTDSVVVTSIVRSAEVGNIFKLGDKYTKAFNLTFRDENNEQYYPVMGCHGIGTSRCMAVIGENFTDDKGLVWPKPVAPFTYHLVSMISPKDDQDVQDNIKETSKILYEKLGSGELAFDPQSKQFVEVELNELLEQNGGKQNATRYNPYLFDDCLWDEREGVSFGAKMADSELIGCPFTIMVTKRSLENGGVEVKVRESGESFVVGV